MPVTAADILICVACLHRATSVLSIRANWSVCDLNAIAIGIGQADYDEFCSLAKHQKASSQSDALYVGLSACICYLCCPALFQERSHLRYGHTAEHFYLLTVVM